MIRNRVSESIIKDMMLTSMYDYRVRVKNMFNIDTINKCLTDVSISTESLLQAVVYVMSKAGIDSSICINKDDFTLQEYTWIMGRLYIDYCNIKSKNGQSNNTNAQSAENINVVYGELNALIVKELGLEELTFPIANYSGLIEVMDFVKDRLQLIKSGLAATMIEQCYYFVNSIISDEHITKCSIMGLYEIIHDFIYYWSLDSGYGFNSSEDEYNKINIAITYSAFKSYALTELYKDMKEEVITIVALLDRMLILGNYKKFSYLNVDEMRLVARQVSDLITAVIHKSNS